jgi:hypothetical protein
MTPTKSVHTLSLRLKVISLGGIERNCVYYDTYTWIYLCSYSQGIPN